MKAAETNPRNVLLKGNDYSVYNAVSKGNNYKRETAQEHIDGVKTSDKSIYMTAEAITENCSLSGEAVQNSLAELVKYGVMSKIQEFNHGVPSFMYCLESDSNKTEDEENIFNSDINLTKAAKMERITEVELLNHISDCIADYEGTEVNELHHNLFNTDYYIVGYYQAEEWLKKHTGVFNAIGEIQEYERENFGEINTIMDSAEAVCNMIVYIYGEELLGELDAVTDNHNEELTAELIKEIQEEIKGRL